MIIINFIVLLCDIYVIFICNTLIFEIAPTAHPGGLKCAPWLLPPPINHIKTAKTPKLGKL